MQGSTFPDGGFVVHKIMINGYKYSCWYGPDGLPRDAERFGEGGATFPVPRRHTKIWKRLAGAGAAWAASERGRRAETGGQ